MTQQRSAPAAAAVVMVFLLLGAACHSGDSGAEVDPTRVGDHDSASTTVPPTTTTTTTTTVPGEAVGGSPLATNLGFFDATAEWAFVDVFKGSGAWVSGTSWAVDRTAVWNDGRPLDVDTAGWVHTLESDQVAHTLMLSGPLPFRPGGQYVVLYDGDADVDGKHALSYGAGAQLVSSSPGRDVIEVDAAGSGIQLDIVATNPGDHVRNIRVIMPGGTDGDVFHPGFLASLAPFRVVRFMNWMRTNNSTQAAWEDRPQPDDIRYTSSKGVPLEVMIDLANRLGIDPWFTLPHLATDDYITNFAQMVKTRLDPSLTPYVEFSNEVWNTEFSQHDWARDQGVALGLDSDPLMAAMKFYAGRATEVFKLWETEFGDGFTAVLGSKSWDASVSQAMLEYEDTADHAELLASDAVGAFTRVPERLQRHEALSPR